MYPQRLPIVDDDDGVWGDILRKYLTKEHFNDDTDNAANGGHKNVTIRAGGDSAGGAPLKFESGTLLTTPQVGAMEFVGDNLYITQTSGTTRKKIATFDYLSPGATGDMYYRDSSGSFARLAAGSASQILTISGGLPSWQTPSTSSIFTDSTFILQDEIDTTKKAQFQLSSISTGQTRTITVPNFNGTMYVTGGTDVSVADGGTGRSTSTTAYGIIAAGTTATGAQQTIAPGTAGQFLKSAGASALAAFASITAADITGTTAQFNAALSDNDFATLAGAEVLTNKTLTNPKIGTILDANGNTSLDIINNPSAVNHVYISNQPAGTYPGLGVDGTDTNIGFDLIPKGNGAVRVFASTGQTPTLQAVGTATNLNFNLVSKGTGRIQANGVTIPTTTSADTLTNKIIDGSSNTISNIAWSGISGKPAVIAAGSSIGAALSAVELTKIVGGLNDSDGRVRGAYARNAIYSHPESGYFVPIPHAYNDIAYNNTRGGSVKILLNGATQVADGNNAAQVFTPDASFSFVDFYVSTSNTVSFEITLHRTFYWGVQFGIQQTDWCRGQDVKFEAYVNGVWTTWLDVANETTGLTWSSTDATGNGATKLRVSLTNFNASTARVTQIFLIGFDSPLFSGTFLPRGGGQLYGDLQVPAVRTGLLRDTNNNGIVELYGVASAVNYFQIQNRPTGAGPGLYAQGADANIDINLEPKGTGTVKVNGTTLPTASSTQTLTNKTIDAASNTLTNISTTSLADGAVTTAKLSSGLQTTITNKADKSQLDAAQLVAVNAQTGAYTLVLSDAGKAIEIDSATDVNLTVPNDASVAFPIGTVIEVLQVGAGRITTVSAAGATINGFSWQTRAQWSTLVLRKRANNLWIVSGDLT